MESGSVGSQHRPALLRTVPLDRALPERLTLRLAASTILPPYFTRAYLHTLELEGLEIDDAALPSPDLAGARALVEGEHLAALASLPATQDLPPGDPRLLWRSVLLARLVMERTPHCLVVGASACRAFSQGSSPRSK